MRVLGISAFYHDSACALIHDAAVVAAAQEERFTRIKHDASFPMNALSYCLNAGKINLHDIDYIVFYDKPFTKFERLLETYLSYAPLGFSSFRQSMPLWIKEKLFQKNTIVRKLQEIDKKFSPKKLLFSEHHLSHAASAFYPSPFDRALVLTMDGVGEWATTTAALGHGKDLNIFKEIHFPHSLGLLYSAFTYYTGFKVNSGEYKVMGLAPYGQPKYAQQILDHLIDIKDDGSFHLNMDYFDYCTGLRMTNERFHSLFDGSPRKPESPVTQKEMDLAASVQLILEMAITKLVTHLRQETQEQYVCLAGGVALNCVANGKLLQEGGFKDIYIQPAAGDAGCALGAALYVSYQRQNIQRIAKGDQMKGTYLGPDFDHEDICQRLKAAGAIFDVYESEALLGATVKALINEKVIGWFQGRMEFGPRALGNRSIIADARSTLMQSKLNLKIKFRESFRPFAPAVLAEDVSDWFELDRPSPYMLLVADVLKKQRCPLPDTYKELFGIEKLHIPRSLIPAVTHVDFSARIQTVHADTNPKFHALLKEFKSQTHCGVLINTSFNIRGEPIVCTPEDAFRCFMGTEMDILVVGNCFLVKEKQNASLKLNYQSQFSLD